MENERRTNRSCTIGVLWVAVVCAFICFPSLAIGLSFFAITVSQLCKDHLEAMTLEAKKNARLADVEKGLTLAAAAQVASSLCPSSAVLCPEGNAGTEDKGQGTAAGGRGQGTLDVGTWSTQAIADCIAKCKKRAAEDPEFAALVERDPAAAVREVQA